MYMLYLCVADLFCQTTQSAANQQLPSNPTQLATPLSVTHETV